MTHSRFARTAGWLAVPCLVAAGLLAWYVTREPASPFATEQPPALTPRWSAGANMSPASATA